MKRDSQNLGHPVETVAIPVLRRLLHRLRGHLGPRLEISDEEEYQHDREQHPVRYCLVQYYLVPMDFRYVVS